MLSDHGSEVIRRYGILNGNIPPEHMFYGVPFPVDFLLAPDRKVIAKSFLPDYRVRPTASAIVLERFGATVGSAAAEIRNDTLAARIRLSSDRTLAGQELAFDAGFELAPGWHVYGRPLPDNYVPLSIEFSDVAAQSLAMPPPRQMTLKAVGETLPVYSGEFRVSGRILLRQSVNPGEIAIVGTLSYQACNDEVCRLPERIEFRLPLRIEPPVPQAK